MCLVLATFIEVKEGTGLALTDQLTNHVRNVNALVNPRINICLQIIIVATISFPYITYPYIASKNSPILCTSLKNRLNNIVKRKNLRL